MAFILLRTLSCSVMAPALLCVALGGVFGVHDHEQRVRRAPDMSGRILTVKGPIDPAGWGPTLMHEHIFIDYTGGNRRVEQADPDLWNQPVSLKVLSLIRANLGQCRDNLLLTDVNLAIEEVNHFKKWGGTAIVDVTSIGLHSNPEGLLKVSNSTGLNIVMGSGYYLDDFLPAGMDQRTVDDLAEIIVRDIIEGSGATGIRSGIIGEVGVGSTPTPNEEKSIRAAARAGAATGAAITFHHGGQGEMKFRTLDIVESEGLAPERVIIGHANHIANDVPYMKRLLDRGVYIEFDLFGEVIPRLGRVHDFDTVRGILALVRAGYEDRILISQDVCTKAQLKAYGGTGFSYVMEFILPELRRLGVTEAQIAKIMIENPKRILTFVAPVR